MFYKKERSNLIRLSLIGCIWLMIAFIPSPYSLSTRANTNIADLKWNTFLGGAGDQYGNGVAIASDGGVFITGNSYATWGNPIRAFTSNGDAYVAKLDANGTLQWNTFLGGSNLDYGFSVSPAPDGGAFVIGSSSTAWGSPLNNFSGTSANIFTARLDANGKLTWHTFVGIGLGFSIATTKSGGIIIAGNSSYSWGDPLRPITGNSGDAFVAFLNANGQLQWNTFLGGDGSDYVNSLALLSDDSIIATGRSDGNWGNPIRSGTGMFTQAFVAKLNSNGTLQWNTFLGGVDYDEGIGIAVNTTGGALITGRSESSWGNPMRPFSESAIPGSAIDTFVASLDASGNLQWNTFLGATGTTIGRSILLLSDGSAIVGGSSTNTWGNPLRPFTGTGSKYEVFIASLASNGSLQWNTFFGGLGNDAAFGMALASNSTIYLTGYSNATWGNPVNAYTGGDDIFVARIDNLNGAAPPTSTPIPATSTPLSQTPTATPARPTATPVPPTATPTSQNSTSTPVRQTATTVPATATPIPPTATPSSPTNFSVMGDNRKIHLSWPSVLNTYVYKVYIECPAGAAPPEQTGNCNEPAFTNENNFVFSGLTNFVTYRVWVVSVDSSGSPLSTLPAVDVMPSAGVFLSLVSKPLLGTISPQTPSPSVTPPPDSCVINDCLEPNNSPSDPTSKNLDFSYAEGIKVGQHIKATVNGRTDPRDYYYLELPAQRKYTISVKYLGDNRAELNLYGYDTQKKQITPSQPPSGPPPTAVSFDTTASGRYYVLVNAFSSDGSQGYELVVEEK